MGPRISPSLSAPTTAAAAGQKSGIYGYRTWGLPIWAAINKSLRPATGAMSVFDLVETNFWHYI